MTDCEKGMVKAVKRLQQKDIGACSVLVDNYESWKVKVKVFLSGRHIATVDRESWGIKAEREAVEGKPTPATLSKLNALMEAFCGCRPYSVVKGKVVADFPFDPWQGGEWGWHKVREHLVPEWK